MSHSTEQIYTAARNQIQEQLGLATSLADVLLDSTQKMVNLNLSIAKASFDTSLASTQRLLCAKDLQEFFSLGTHETQPHTDIVLTFARDLANITSGAQIALTRVAEEQVNRRSKQMVNLIDEFGKLAPAGSESALSLIKSAMDNVSASMGQLARNSKIAVETMEHNITLASTSASESQPKSGRARG